MRDVCGRIKAVIAEGKTAVRGNIASQKMGLLHIKMRQQCIRNAEVDDP
jgi:hypothetical protein